MANKFRVYLSRPNVVPETGKPHAKCADAMREFMKVVLLCVQKNVAASVSLEQLSGGRWNVLRRLSTQHIGRAHFPDGQFDSSKFHYDGRDAR